MPRRYLAGAFVVVLVASAVALMPSNKEAESISPVSDREDAASPLAPVIATVTYDVLSPAQPPLRPVERQAEPECAACDEAVPQPPEAAVRALRESMQHGDPRTPPIVRSTDLREPPTPAELADPQLYQEYEWRQQQQVHASFVQAASRKITELEALIAQGREFGIAPEQLHEGMEKLEAIRTQRDELLTQYPDLLPLSETESAEPTNTTAP